MAHIEELRVFPVKGLDGVTPSSARITEGGTLAGDREFALFDADGDVVNAKRTDRFHRLSTDYDPGTATLTAETPDGERRRFDLASDPDAAADWLGTFLGETVTLRRDRSTGFVDRPEMGPSVVSTATLREVASWFDGLRVESVRRRLRTNVEVGGVPAFWEDRFVGEAAPAFVAGGVRFEGVTPCARCVVPSRDPDTGEPTPAFREQFVERRSETFPAWADRAAFDHDYTLTVITRVPEADRGRTLRVGDDVETVEVVAD
jgi:hypothetical protein